MLESIFKNQVIMTFFIASIWIIPGLFFSTATQRKYKKRTEEIRTKKISRLYPTK